MKTFDLISTVRRILTPQEVLAPFAFDENNKMLPQVREKLLKIADFIIQKTVADVPGLEVFDVCLSGSAASYFYYNKSDFDVKIEVHNKNCPFLAKDKKHLDKFLATQILGLKQEDYVFKYQNRLIDYKMASYEVDFRSVYSIKNDCWRIEPKKEVDISESEMVEYYLKRKSEIMEEYEKIKQKYRGPDLGKQLNDFYVRTILRSIEGNPQIKDHLVFKLLNYERILKPIGSDSIVAYNQAFNLKAKP